MRILFLFLLGLLLGVAPLRAASLPDAARFSIVIEQGDVALAREWLDGGLAPDFEGRVIGTGLMIAAWYGNIPMMDLFLARGADINKTNAFGEQAVQHAAWQGHVHAVRWLVERGARINREGMEWSALHYAAFAGHVDVVRYLLAQGADINALSTNGSTPLMMAAREGREGIAGILLAAGARRDIVNEHGENAVTWAMRHNNLSIARAIGGSAAFAATATRPAASWGAPVRSQPVPDRVDAIMAAARRMEAEGRRDDALGLYRAALAAIRQADATRKIAPAPARTATGMVITARRDQPETQSAAVNYAPPAQSPAATKVSPGDPATAAAPADVSDDWLRRARELEASGRRKEALQAYRQAAASLRAGTAVPARAATQGPAPPP